jgi:hypothetical protein
LVGHELIQRVHHIQLYLFVYYRYLLRQLIEDIDDILTHKDDVLILILIDFQLAEKTATSIADVTTKTAKKMYDTFCKFFYLISSLLVTSKLFSQNGMKHSSFLDEQLPHNFNLQQIINDSKEIEELLHTKVSNYTKA